MGRTLLIRWIARALVVLAVLVGLGTWWSWYAIQQGEEHLRAAQALTTVGKLHEAIIQARQAASWYVPGARHVDPAYDQLVSLARLAESRGDRDTALFAWRSLRSAAMVSRSWFLPNRGRVRAAEHAIARLASHTPPPLGAPMQEPEQIRQSLLASYQTPLFTRPPWVVVMLLGGWLSAVGVWFMAYKGLEDDKLQRRPMLVAVTVFGLGFAAWLIGTWMA